MAALAPREPATPAPLTANPYFLLSATSLSKSKKCCGLNFLLDHRIADVNSTPTKYPISRYTQYRTVPLNTCFGAVHRTSDPKGTGISICRHAPDAEISSSSAVVEPHSPALSLHQTSIMSAHNIRTSERRSSMQSISAGRSPSFIARLYATIRPVP